MGAMHHPPILYGARMLRVVRLALLLLVALPLPLAHAQAEDGGGSGDDGGVIGSQDAGTEDAGSSGGGDGGLPDASVGEGGADRDNEQGDDTTGRVVTVCDRASDCSPGFSCSQGRCTWIGVREAEGGFGCGDTGASAAMLLPLGIFFGFVRRRGKRSGRSGRSGR